MLKILYMQTVFWILKDTQVLSDELSPLGQIVYAEAGGKSPEAVPATMVRYARMEWPAMIEYLAGAGTVGVLLMQAHVACGGQAG